MIPGMCTVWCKRVLKDPDPWKNIWFKLPQAPRGYQECEALVDYYEEEWGNIYHYTIRSAADNQLRTV